MKQRSTLYLFSGIVISLIFHLVLLLINPVYQKPLEKKREYYIQIKSSFIQPDIENAENYVTEELETAIMNEPDKQEQGLPDVKDKQDKGDNGHEQVEAATDGEALITEISGENPESKIGGADLLYREQFILLKSLLEEEIEKNKIYPLLAVKKGLEGTVEVFFKLDSMGNLLEVEITGSSGYKILDSAAKSLIKRITPFQHGLNTACELIVPIRYYLED
jgi:TonB family protein